MFVAQTQAIDCYVQSGDKLACAFGDFAAATGGETTFGLLLGGVLLASLYKASGSVIVPAVALTLLAGFLVPIMPGALAGVSGGIVVIGIAAAIFAGLRRYALAGVQ
jgi:hypothetical protein